MAKDIIEDQTNKVFAKKEIEPDLLDRVTDFFSRERGLERSEKLEDAIRYYLGPYAGSLGQANQLLNPVVGLQDAGEATREGRYVDAVTDTAAAALPIAGAVAVKPLARGVQSGIDEAVDAVTEVMTGGTFDKGRRKVLGTMVAAPVAVAAGSTGIVDELIAPLAKKVAGSGSLSGSLAKLKSLNSKRADLSIKMNKLLGDQSPYSYGVTSRIPPKNLIELEGTDKILSSTIKETNKEFFENTLNLITETNLKKLSKEELEELSDKMFDGINSDLDGNNFEQIKGLTEKFNDKNILMAKEYERLGLDNNTYYNHLEMIDDELANFDDLPQGVKDAINNNEDRVVRVPLFNKGGTAMKDQMEMNFGEAETVDPVSGNDVPPGSLPEEVRDDIPARLSEGEYVVPADVVRYYGVKFFEDLRDQAKMGLQQMDEDGRIGGEPIETSEAEVDIDDLIDAEINNMNEGGVVDSGYGGILSEEGNIKTAPRFGYIGSSYGGRRLNYGKPILTARDVLPEVETTPLVDIPEVPGQTTAETPFTGIRNYYDAQGNLVPIHFINGQPAGGPQVLIGLSLRKPSEGSPSDFTGSDSTRNKTLGKRPREASEILKGLSRPEGKYDDPVEAGQIEKIVAWAEEKENQYDRMPAGLIGFITDRVSDVANEAQIRATSIIAKERGFTKFAEQLDEIVPPSSDGVFGLGIGTGRNYAQAIRDEAVRIKAGPDDGGKSFAKQQLPGLGNMVKGIFGKAKTFDDTKEGLFREDFAPGESGDEAFTRSMQYTAPDGYVYVPGTTKVVPSSTVTSTVDTGMDLISSTKTTPSRSVTTQGYYQKGDDYATGYVGGKKEEGLVRAKLRPSSTDDTPAVSASSSVKGAYVTNAVDSYGNKIRTGTGVAAGVAPDTTYSYSNPKPGSVKDQQDKASAVSTPTTSTSSRSGTGWFRGEDESGNTGSNSSKGGYSCYVATALNVNGYWNITKKIRLLKWCIDTKPEGKLDTLLWRNGYCVFGKKLVAPYVHNKYIQWLSNGFYDSVVKNKKTIQARLGKLFFYVPSYTIGLAKAFTGNLKTIDRT